MPKRKVSTDELSNVSGGGGGGTPSEVRCPNCQKNIYYGSAVVRTEKDGCDTKTYYKCPECKYEWND